jgi:hypothetical protein
MLLEGAVLAAFPAVVSVVGRVDALFVTHAERGLALERALTFSAHPPETARLIAAVTMAAIGQRVDALVATSRLAGGAHAHFV